MALNPLRDPAVKAICFLKSDGDDRNCVYFTLEKMVVAIKGRKHITPIEQIKQISLGNRKLLGPIVIGGILFPLSSLAIASSFGNPFLMLIFSIAGVLLLLYGFGGSPAISIHTSGGIHHYFISRTGSNIERFIKYFNSREYLKH